MFLIERFSNIWPIGWIFCFRYLPIFLIMGHDIVIYIFNSQWHILVSQNIFKWYLHMGPSCGYMISWGGGERGQNQITFMIFCFLAYYGWAKGDFYLIKDDLWAQLKIKVRCPMGTTLSFRPFLTFTKHALHIQLTKPCKWFKNTPLTNSSLFFWTHINKNISTHNQHMVHQ